MSQALLLRPQYPYGRKQVWMPMDLIKVASRMKSANIETKIIDLNLENKPEDISAFDYIGIGVVGPPYIPDTQELFQDIRSKTDKPILLGGPGVENLRKEEFKRLYPGAVQIANDIDFANAVNNKPSSVYDVNINAVLSMMPLNLKKTYLSNEFSFFVSQGCKYSCSFCAAKKSMGEQFSSTIKADLDALCLTAKSADINNLSMYLSSLDLFQTPHQILETLEIFSEASHTYNIRFNLRGLSRINSFLNALEKEKSLYEVIPSSGLAIVGFGVDGTSEKIWKSQHKGMISLSDADKAYDLCNQLSIVPEALLVMGFHDKNGLPVDNLESLKKNVTYAYDCSEKYGVVIRPHVAKDMTPGNDGWNNPAWAAQKEFLLENPKYFKNLDYVALASQLTHPNPAFRDEINDAYMQIIEKLSPENKCATHPLMPYSGNLEHDDSVDKYNMRVPADR